MSTRTSPARTARRPAATAARTEVRGRASNVRSRSPSASRSTSRSRSASPAADKTSAKKEQNLAWKKHDERWASLVSLAYQIGKRGALTLRDAEGAEVKVDTPVLSSLMKQIKSETNELVKMKTKRASGTKRKATITLSMIAPTFRDFWKNANLGPSDPNNPNSAPLAEMLPLLTDEGIASITELQSAWATYVSVNNLSRGGKFIQADAHMKKYLGPLFEYLARQDGFDPNNFDRTRLQTVSSAYIIPRAGGKLTEEKQDLKNAVGNDRVLTQEEIDILNDPETKQAFTEELELLKRVRQIYKAEA